MNKLTISLAAMVLAVTSCRKEVPEYGCRCYDANDNIVVVVPLKTESRQTAIDACEGYESPHLTDRHHCSLE